jgi:transposase
MCANSCVRRCSRETSSSSTTSAAIRCQVEEAIRATGATLLYLPPYSPDFNPIEKFFSKLKALLRKAAKRSIDALWKEIGDLINAVTPDECLNFFASCGYVNTQIENVLVLRL